MEKFIFNMLLDSCRTLLRINTNTLTVTQYVFLGVRYAGEESEHDSISFLESLIQSGLIFEADVWKLRFLQLPREPLQAYLKQKNGSAIVYRIREKEKWVWSRLSIILPQNFGSENPDVLLMTNTMPVDEAMFYEANEVGFRDVYKIFRLDFLDNSVSVIKEPRSERHLHQRADVIKSTKELLQLFCKDMVHPDDADFFREAMDKETVVQHFAAGNQTYSFYYRRKVGTLYRWVKMLITPALDSTAEHPVFFYLVCDEHRAILKLMDIDHLMQYLDHYSEFRAVSSVTNYENMLSVLHELTERYLEYYMVDLENDLYIQYKFKSDILGNKIPSVGCYSAASKNFIQNHASGDAVAKLNAYSTPQKLRDAMQDRMTLEYEFVTEDGRAVRTVIRKVEAIHGIPTKVICYSLPSERNERKLKVRCFGNFDVFLPGGEPVPFARKQSKQFLAYLINKQGYPVTSADIAEEMLERDPGDRNALKYVSTLIRRAMSELEAAGFDDVILKEQKTLRVNRERLDCDYYRLLDGDVSMWEQYHNEYMKEYSWAEETAAELLYMASR